MKQLLQKLILISFAAIVIIAIPGCGSSQELASSWPAKAIQIDGNSQDWQGTLQDFPKKNYSLGFRNNDKFLYLCFTTTDKQLIFNAIRTGLNITFNSATDNTKNYTIKYPTISPAILKEAMSGFSDEALEKESVNFLFQEVLDKQFQFSILQEKIISTVPVKNAEGIEIRTGSTNELLVYEVKVPLASAESKFPVGALPGEKINVVISTDPSRVAFREGMSAGGPNAPTGRGGGGNRSRASNASQGDGGQTTITEKFETGFTIQLAKEAIKN